MQNDCKPSSHCGLTVQRDTESSSGADDLGDDFGDVFGDSN